MGPLLGVDPGLPFGLYFFPLTSEQLSIIYIKCQEHISEQFLFLSLFCFCWHWWSEGPICGTFLQESKSWSKLSPYHRFEGTSKTEIDQGFQKSWSHPRQSILWFIIIESLSSFWVEICLKIKVPFGKIFSVKLTWKSSCNQMFLQKAVCDMTEDEVKKFEEDWTNLWDPEITQNDIWHAH